MGNKQNKSLNYTGKDNINDDNKNESGLFFKDNKKGISKTDKQDLSSNDTKRDNTSNDSIKKDNNSDESKKKKICIIVSFLILLVIIAGLILLIGHLVFGWFNDDDYVIIPYREKNFVSRYLEIKNCTNSYFYEGRNETNQKIQNYSISTNFILAIDNKNVKLIHNKKDYLYEAFILIINITEINDTNSVYLGGINIYDDSKSIDDLINNNEDLFKNISLDDNNQKTQNKTQINVPISKFDFYENGTIDKKYFPLDINEFYKSALIDLIEKVTPKISKSLYEEQKNRRRLNQKKEGKLFNYEQIIKNNKLYKTIFYEDNLVKNIDKKKDEDLFEKNEMNSKITRTFDPYGDLVSVEMEGEAIFRSGPPKSNKDINLRLIEEGEEKVSETNESYFNLGLDEFKINVASNMKLIQSKIEPLTLLRLNELCQKIYLVIYRDSNISETNLIIANQSIMDFDNIDYKNDSYYLNNSNSTNHLFEIYIINDTNITGYLRNNNTINSTNYLNSYKSKYKIISTNFLGFYISLQQNLYINKNNGFRQNYINFNFDGKEINLSTIDMHQYYYSSAKYAYKSLLDSNIGLISKKFKSFGFSIQASLNLKLNLDNWIAIDIINGEMYTKGLTNFNLGLTGSFGPDFNFISFGAELIGNIAQGNTYIQANTLLNINSKEARFLYHKKLSSCRVDLNFYFTVRKAFLNYQFNDTFNLFKGNGSYEHFSEIF